MSSNDPAGKRGVALAPAGLTVRGRRFTWGTRTYLMGIVNATPDSFSGDGCASAEDAVRRARELFARGADILDLGAESTRPGHVPVDAALECERLLPVVRGVRAALPDAPLSIDTYKADVFAAAHDAGGDLLNSVWGLSDPLLALAAARDVPVVIMHNKRVAAYDGNVVDEVLAYLLRQAECAVAAGIERERVILDPGIGFGKTPEHNLAVLGALERLVALGFPTLLGTSRKSTIGKLTGRAVDARTYGTAATVALAVAAKVDIVRVHDVAEMRDTVDVADAVVRGWRPPRLAVVSGTIALRGIRAFGRHGADPGERERDQPLDIDLELDVDLAAAAASDALGDTVDYAAVHALVVRLVRERSYRLLERLADVLATEIMQDARIMGAALTIAKPRLLAGATPSVTLRRERPRAEPPRG